MEPPGDDAGPDQRLLPRRLRLAVGLPVGVPGTAEDTPSIEEERPMTEATRLTASVGAIQAALAG